MAAIDITLIYKVYDKTHRKKIQVSSVPCMGERVIVPDEDNPRTVLMVEHDLRVDPVNILVVVD